MSKRETKVMEEINSKRYLNSSLAQYKADGARNFGQTPSKDHLGSSFRNGL